MPDVSCVYALTTGGGNINFNNGGADQFYITEIQGLSGMPVRAPTDPVPFGDGARSYNWWQAGRQFTVEGIFLITSTRVMNSILRIRNDMEDDLRAALDSIGAGATPGGWAWTPLGGSSSSLTVRNNVPLECPHDQGYLVRTFTFGLWADDPSY